MKITTEMTEAAYSYAKNVYEERTSKEDALDMLVGDFGMNRNSAADYLNNFQHMMDGEKYTRTNNSEATEYYLSHIFSDYGPSKLSNALSAVDQHIAYYEAVGRGNLNGIRSVYNKYKDILKAENQYIFPDEVQNPDRLYEGAKRTVIVNSYERNPKARNQSIEYYGASCSVCGFDFEKKYGEIGSGFIHVHHLIQLSNIGEGYGVDPIEDLRPVCPNCHSMLHRRNPPYSIEELKSCMKIT